MALHESLNLRQEEVFPVSLLVLQSVFLGFFLGAFDVGANTLFLNNFDQSMIPKAIVISGITGIVLTSVYSFFQNRLRFSTLAQVNLFFVFFITFLLRAGYYISDTKWLAFALFVLMGPLNIVALVGFWGTAGRIFDIRQGKRIFGFVDTGQVIGVIISSLSIPFLVTIGFKTKNLLYISAISMFLAFVFQVIISAKFPKQLKIKAAKAAKKSTFADTLRIPYVRTIATFVVLSMLVAFFVHYLFLAVASQRFDNPDELAKYFGGLMGTLTVVSVLIKTFVYGSLMKTYGLRVSLLVSPVIMTIVTVSAAIIGSFFGYTLESASFTFFFLLISLSKFFQKALKDSIESPVLKLIYQSLSPSIRHEVQARVDGTINEMAALASGVVLTVMGLFSFIGLIHYVYFLLGFIAIWFYISLKLFQGYRKTLKQTLDSASEKEIQHDATVGWIENFSGLSIPKQLELISFSRPWLLPDFLGDKLRVASSQDLEILCEYIVKYSAVKTIPFLVEQKERTSSEETVGIYDKTILELKGIVENAEDEAVVNSLLASKDYLERIQAAKLLGQTTKTAEKLKLTFLLRDLVPQVKKQAIWASRATHSKEIISFLIDFLDKDDYAPMAHGALIGSGEIGLEMLLLAFNRTGVSDQFRKRIIRIIPETGSAIAANVLFGKLDIKSNLKTEVLNGLLKLDFVADDREEVALHQLLVEQAGICAWNLNALHHCPPESKAPNLKSELEHEFSVSRHNLFQLLKLQYDKSSIEAVIENLEVGTGESISFAIELLDTFIVEDLKPYIFPILEDTTLANKIWALQSYFPLREYTVEELLNAIINRNENLMGKQAKIYAMNAHRNIEQLSVTTDLTAQLFNTDKVLRQISANLIQRIDQQKYISTKKRLNDRLRVELDRNIEMAEATKVNIIERLAFFTNLPYCEVHAAPLFWLYNSTPLLVSETDILSLGIFRNKAFVILVQKGSLTLKKHSGETVISTGEIIITNDLITGNDSLYAVENTVIHYVEYSKYVAEVYNNEYLIDYLK
ncbi:MAG TPA: hypothetical protein PLM76_10190 [Tenuifilaceae bacterium]|nr:hypothetical protein [Tenuifilaceae bacterium]